MNRVSCCVVKSAVFVSVHLNFAYFWGFSWWRDDCDLARSAWGPSGSTRRPPRCQTDLRLSPRTTCLWGPQARRCDSRGSQLHSSRSASPSSKIHFGRQRGAQCRCLLSREPRGCASIRGAILRRAFSSLAPKLTPTLYRSWSFGQPRQNVQPTCVYQPFWQYVVPFWSSCRKCQLSRYEPTPTDACTAVCLACRRVFLGRDETIQREQWPPSASW